MKHPPSIFPPYTLDHEQTTAPVLLLHLIDVTSIRLDPVHRKQVLKRHFKFCVAHVNFILLARKYSYSGYLHTLHSSV